MTHTIREPHRYGRAGLAIIASTVASLWCDTALAQTTQDLKRLTLEELTGMEISTVSRAPEPASEVPAAVFVITPEMIRRSGLTSPSRVARWSGVHGAPAKRRRHSHLALLSDVSPFR